MSTVNEHHFGAVFKDQVSDSTVGQSDSHQVLALQRQNLYKQNHLSTSLIKTHCRTIWPNFNQKGTKDKNICVLFFGSQSKVPSAHVPAHGRPQSPGPKCWLICQPFVSSSLPFEAWLWKDLHKITESKVNLPAKRLKRHSAVRWWILHTLLQ